MREERGKNKGRVSEERRISIISVFIVLLSSLSLPFFLPDSSLVYYAIIFI
jgi:hypothetical protein